MSRTTVREALRHLQAQGLLSPKHDLLELRLVIETAALVRAAQAPVAEQLAEARAAIGAMENPRVSQAAVLEADVAFHAALVAASGNEALRLVILAVKDSIRAHLDETMRGRTFAKIRPRVLDEHRKLIAAVEGGHVKAVGALLRAHLEFYGT